MQNPIQNFRQSSIISKKPGVSSKNSKTLTSSNYPTGKMFCWNFAHVSYLTISTKGCVGFSLFCLDLELFAKIKKYLVSTHSFSTLLWLTQDLNKMKKIPHSFADITK